MYQKFYTKLNSKKYFESNILNKKFQNIFMKHVYDIQLYQGDWEKNGRNISNISFIRMK